MMPFDRVEISSANKAFCFVIERHILCRDRKAFDERLDHPGANKARNSRIHLRNLVGVIHWITGKKLVAAIAAEGDRNVLSNELRQ